MARLLYCFPCNDGRWCGGAACFLIRTQWRRRRIGIINLVIAVATVDLLSYLLPILLSHLNHLMTKCFT